MDWQYILEGLQTGIQEMSWLEAVAVFFGLASVYYSMKENILVFPTGIISTLIYVWICFQVRLYADMGINGYYFVMSIVGWYIWSHPRPGKASVPITWLGTRGMVNALLLLLVSYVTLYFVLHTFTDSDVPYWDSFTTATAFVGMWLMAKKKVENWIAWIITDVVSVPLYLYKGLLLTSFQFLVFTVLAVLGLVAWIRIAKVYALKNG
ncbi:nicotinamide riboside transporter PnuC [Cyclobacterium sp.]|uniref:nicotinamide riboside transporter PnuC n=1 Tax=Cyclobacterium sp. TaxID=1966343 RepID=UPI0019A06A15|nr:nicotinamide riboside transporter PnuC [Cyclobacterium sp.]MBD3626901.1 nicotinamide mononucleotide transporter [Cyclobacterium sp.]